MRKEGEGKGQRLHAMHGGDVIASTHRSFVLENDDGNEDHNGDQCQPQVDDEHAHVD